MGSIPYRVAAVLLIVSCDQVPCEHVPSNSRPEDCTGCHSAASSEWSGSSHAHAFDNPVFQVSWSETQAPWCLSCHLPDNGVTCATCHGPESKTCADCHEFDLPKELGGAASGTLGQSTVSEWMTSGAAKQELGCSDCHAPHRGKDRQRVRAAIGAKVMSSDETVYATVTTADIGHAFPTGDPFRRLQLTVCADLVCQRPIARVELERRLKRTADGGWALANDTRVPAPTKGLNGTRTFELHAPDARSWRLVMHLTDPRHTQDLGELASYVVANGLVEPL